MSYRVQSSNHQIWHCLLTHLRDKSCRVPPATPLLSHTNSHMGNGQAISTRSQSRLFEASKTVPSVPIPSAAKGNRSGAFEPYWNHRIELSHSTFRFRRAHSSRHQLPTQMRAQILILCLLVKGEIRRGTIVNRSQAVYDIKPVGDTQFNAH